MKQRIWKVKTKMNEFEAYEKIVKEWKAVNKMQDLNSCVNIKVHLPVKYL